MIVGNAYLFWGEEMATWGGEVFDVVVNSNPAFAYSAPAITYNKFDNSWADPYTMYDLTDFVVNNVPTVGDYIGITEIYESQLF